MTAQETAAPVQESSIFLVIGVIVPSLNAVSIVDVSVSIETSDEARLIVFDAEKTGLLYFLYFITFTIARVSEVKVYAAMAIAVII